MGIDINKIAVESFIPKDKNLNKVSVSIKELLNKDIQLFGPSFNAKKKEALYSELNILLVAGLDVQKSLQLIEDGLKKKKDKALINKIRENLVSGMALSESFLKTQEFSEYEVFSIKIGEETGRLNLVLEELSLFYSKSAKFRQLLIGALSYPAFISGFSMMVVFFLLKYLVPLFSDVYKRFGGTMPKLTLYIIALSDWLGKYSGILGISLVIIFLGLHWQRREVWFRRLNSTFLIRLPIFGGMIKKIYLARFCQSMSLLLGSKVSLLRVVELVRKMVGFYPIEISLLMIEQEILNGALLNEALAKSKFYPPQLVALIKVGEEAGNLDTMFSKLAAQYNQEVEDKTKLIGTLIEPVLIVSLGFVVGVVLIAMYLPLFQMSTGIKH
jgi:type IV pilus assembly protein PilC